MIDNRNIADTLEALFLSGEADSVKLESYSKLLDEGYLDLLTGAIDAEQLMRIVEIQVMFDRKLKENEISLLRKSNEIKQLSLEKQELIKRFLFLVIFLVLFFLIVLFFRFRALARAKEQLERQTQEIEDANTKLVGLNAMRDKLFAVISHDLRNPFASIVSFSRIIKRDLDEMQKDDIRELVEELDKSVISISNLLDNLLQWSKAQSGKLPFNPAEQRLSDIIDTNVRLYDPIARDKQIGIIVDFDRDIMIYADADLTDGIVRNLLSNAIKFTVPGGRVTIFASLVNDEVHVRISDTGRGMDAREQSELLSPDAFFSTRGTVDERGSGLGLLICQEFAARQGGKLWFTSEKGVGSDFYFSLPAVK